MNSKIFLENHKEGIGKTTTTTTTKLGRVVFPFEKSNICIQKGHLKYSLDLIKTTSFD